MNRDTIITELEDALFEAQNRFHEGLDREFWFGCIGAYSYALALLRKQEEGDRTEPEGDFRSLHLLVEGT
jgi:hypothetical protein